MSNDDEISNLSINLGLDSRQIRGQDGIDVKFTLTNNSNKTLNVLKWQLPIDGIGNNDLFWVKREEEVAVYLGKVLKRAAPTPDDYITLDPNETISTDFDLAEVYDISKAGNYAVEFDSRVLDIGTEEPKTMATRFSETHGFHQQRLRSNAVQFNLLEDRAAKTSNGVALQWSTLLDTTSELPNFRACTTNQQNQIEESLSQAKNIVKQAQSDLSNSSESNRSNARRYREWFGEYSKQNFNKVKGNFDKILNAFMKEKIIFNCSMEDCRPGVFAYVYPAKPYQIFLCDAFWSAAVTGTDSRSGTMVHETSHFNVVAGTDDNVYGQPRCRQLAIDNPKDAIANADSHEYFAENTPPLNM